MQKIVYQGSALLLLLTIGVEAAGGRDYYAQHRHALCLMNRLLRLAFSSAQLMSSGARMYMAPALALRTQSLQQRPFKALMIITLHPVIFWLMQVCHNMLFMLAGCAVCLSAGLHVSTARSTSFTLCSVSKPLQIVIPAASLCSPHLYANHYHLRKVCTCSLHLSCAGAFLQAHFVLPWRYAVLMQLANTAVALSFWSRQLPCFLQAIQLQQNSTSQLFYQPQASELCQALQYLGSGLRMALGDVTYVLHDNAVCEGLRAVQVLQAFATIVGLLLLPLSVTYGIEQRFKLRFLRSLEQAEGGAVAADAAGVAGVNAGSSNSSSSRAEASAAAASEGTVDGGAGSTAAAALYQVGEEPHCAVVLRWVACLSGLLVGSWLLAEVLVTDVFSKATCAADG
jgi:hypothetical protein